MEITIIIFLILLNGFFALAEIALVSSKPHRLEQYRKEGRGGATKALRLLEHSEDFLSAIQVGITLIGIVTGVYGGTSIARDVAPLFERWSLTAPYAQQIALTLTVVVITYFSIVIGELVPKTFALSKPDRIAVRIAPVIWYFSKLFYPFVWLLGASTNLINRLMGIKKPEETLTETELRQMIRQATAEGVILPDQNRIHERVFYFADKKAKHIMTHHSDVEWIDLDDPEPEIRAAVLKAGHGQLVASRKSIDRFEGMLSVRDYLTHLVAGKPFTAADLLTRPIIVHENIPATEVVELFRKRKKHAVVVTDEYGCFEGMITPHDIVENFVGELPFEGEPNDPDVFVREDRSVLVSGDAPIETLAEVMENFTVDFETIDYSTVAGFVLERLNKIPHVGDRFETGGYEIEIVDMDGHKIDKILIRKIETMN